MIPLEQARPLPGFFIFRLHDLWPDITRSRFGALYVISFLDERFADFLTSGSPRSQG
jgi:hypothetical protein